MNKNEDDGTDDGSIDGSSLSGAVGTGNDARVALLEAINDANDEQRADELANINDDDSTEPFRAGFVKDSEDDPTALPEDAKDPEVEVKNPNPPPGEKIKLRVNGKDLELSLDEVIARAQKVESADEYLRAAKHQTPKEPVVQGPSPEELQRLQDEEDLKLVRAIQMGTEVEAAAALRVLREQAAKGAQRPSLSRDEVSSVIDERLSFNAAMNGFQKEYKDIWDNPRLRKMAQERDVELIQQGDDRPYSDRFAEIGNEIRSWRDSIVKDVHPAATNDDIADKAKKKASAPKVPTAASAKVKPKVQEEDDDKEESPADVIAKMQQYRGGTQRLR